MAWTRRVLDMGLNWMRGKRIGMVVAETGGLLLSVPAISYVRAIISMERVIRSSSVLLRWRVAMVMFAFFLVPMVFGFGVLVMVWSLEFVGVAMVIVGS